VLLERKVVVGVRDGLHARPATQFVKLARGFEAAIEIERHGRRADAKSSVRLMLLGVKEQDEVTLYVDGSDADTALEHLTAFITCTDPATPAMPAPSSAVSIQSSAAPMAAPMASGPPMGLPASEGVAMGIAFPFFPEILTASSHAAAIVDADSEIARHAVALDTTIDRLVARKARGGVEAEAIIDALIEVARDPEFLRGTTDLIRCGQDAVSATLKVGEEIAHSFESVDDPYLRARSEDIRSVSRNLALALLGRSEASLADLPQGAIIVADEMTAWDLSTANLSAVAGILCRQGTPLSHVAIMARSHGIPAVVGAPLSIADLQTARVIALDGRTGEVFLDPDEVLSAKIRARLEEEAHTKAALDAYRTIEPVTRDGRRIEIAANIGTLREIDAALKAGAHGVGLFRTEFLFMERKTLPTEDEQTATYSRLVEAFAPYPVIVRTLDVGGDKPVAGIEFPHEDNPFLGWRGVRMCLDRPTVFMPQLKALLRAAMRGRLKVMIPMIADAGEIEAVRGVISQCRAELTAAGVAYGEFELGIMVETPAAALMAEELAEQVSFFSIGTNDLTQYVMAADRLNPRVAGLNRTEHPAVLRAIEGVCRAASRAGIPVGICGEAAARPDLIETFVRMGVTELSMSPASIPRAKKCVTEI
jgi:phosphotransferase system enzyme I (PtsI)